MITRGESKSIGRLVNLSGGSSKRLPRKLARRCAIASGTTSKSYATRGRAAFAFASRPNPKSSYCSRTSLCRVPALTRRSGRSSSTLEPVSRRRSGQYVPSAISRGGGPFACLRPRRTDRQRCRGRGRRGAPTSRWAFLCDESGGRSARSARVVYLLRFQDRARLLNGGRSPSAEPACLWPVGA